MRRRPFSTGSKRSPSHGRKEDIRRARCHAGKAARLPEEIRLPEGSGGHFTPASEYGKKLAAEREAGLRPSKEARWGDCPGNRQLETYAEGAAAEESDSEVPATSGIPKLPNGVPARLCVEKGHPDFDECYTRIGVKFNGIERKSDVYAYDVAAGFIRVHIRDNKGRWKQSRGRFVTVKLNGVVEPYWR